MREKQQDGAARASAQWPIDPAHLERQTFGDPALEREVLELFLVQAQAVRDGLATADSEARRRLAHSLTGAARAVGAFALGERAAELEASPDDAALVERLCALIGEVDAFARERMRPNGPGAALG